MLINPNHKPLMKDSRTAKIMKPLRYIRDKTKIESIDPKTRMTVTEDSDTYKQAKILSDKGFGKQVQDIALELYNK